MTNDEKLVEAAETLAKNAWLKGEIDLRDLIIKIAKTYAKNQKPPQTN